MTSRHTRQFFCYQHGNQRARRAEIDQAALVGKSAERRSIGCLRVFKALRERPKRKTERDKL